MELSPDEFNALNKIASATKMDWFYLVHHNDRDIVYDLENGQRIDFPDAICQLAEGMVEPVSDPFYKLSKSEIQSFSELMHRAELGLL